MPEVNKYNIVAFGEVLWDLLPDKSIIGGAPFNFTYRIHSLRENGLMISRVGDDQLGRQALREIWNMGLSFEYIQNDPVHPTGTVNIFFDEGMNPDFTINPGVAYDYIAFTSELAELCESIDCFCYGTLAQRHPESRETLYRMLDMLDDALCFCDVNLRKDCFSAENVKESLKRAHIVKMNDSEAAILKEMLSLKASGLADFGRLLTEGYDLELCLITLGEYGVLAVPGPGEPCYVPGIKIELKDPLGAGDAFSAGFIYSWLRKVKLSDACEFGNAMGAIVATQKGATVPVRQGEMESFTKRSHKRNIDERLKEYMH